jgi:hypothetical protein
MPPFERFELALEVIDGFVERDAPADTAAASTAVVAPAIGAKA